MQHESGTLESRLVWQSWRPESPKAIVLIAHGLAEHSGRYPHVAEALTQAGYAVFAVDHAGHGQSPGKRGGVYDFNILIEGMLELDRHARVALPGLPVTLLGHSMGGLIAALTAKEIGGAGLDVYEREPEVPAALRRLDTVTLLPHLGTAALEVRDDMGRMALDNVIAAAEGHTPPNVV